ncbi:putative nuclear pore glycoprotein p62-like [Penaeus vannamei]|uniref:Putative nuclear pore glycoprotein p62-like n=1 Tax=Penaeus vannamei TaxID=6689 RepID=A0A423TE27_PENVA|nr:putative nuclear pore glycoprotein p62-like [Penaeus vannamei]
MLLILLGQALSVTTAPAPSLPAASGATTGGIFNSGVAAPAPVTAAATPSILATSTATSSVPASTPALATLTTATSTSSASITAAPAAATPTLSVRGLEEKVNKWVSEMREQEERLMRQAAHVNAWDQLLQKGHDQVQQLRDTLNTVEVDQQRLQAELDFIQGQQQELEQLIEPLESAASTTSPAQHQGDRQRENMYHIAQSLLPHYPLHFDPPLISLPFPFRYFTFPFYTPPLLSPLPLVLSFGVSLSPG